MKSLLIDMMAAMMPYMKPLVLLAAASLLVAIVLRLAGRRRPAALLAGFVTAVGAFFIICEVMGRLLGFEPTILFADPANRKLYTNQFPFWVIGLAALVPGWLIRAASRS